MPAHALGVQWCWQMLAPTCLRLMFTRAMPVICVRCLYLLGESSIRFREASYTAIAKDTCTSPWNMNGLQYSLQSQIATHNKQRELLSSV